MDVDTRSGKPWPVPGIRLAIDDIHVNGHEVSFYDYYGDCYDNDDRDTLLEQLIEKKVGYPVRIIYCGEGNGHFGIKFVERP